MAFTLLRIELLETGRVWFELFTSEEVLDGFIDNLFSNYDQKHILSSFVLDEDVTSKTLADQAEMRDMLKQVNAQLALASEASFSTSQWRELQDRLRERIQKVLRRNVGIGETQP